MQTKTTLCLAIGLLLFASCKKETINTDHLKPLVSFEKEKYNTEAGTPVEITPTVKNADKSTTYKWETEGKEISAEAKLSFTPTEAKEYTLTLTATNQYGAGKASCTVTAAALPPYRGAVFLMAIGSRGQNGGAGNQAPKVNGRLMALKADGSFENDAFGAANNGKKLGYSCMQPVVSNGKIYILADAGVEDFKKAELVIADALTLKHEKTIAFDAGDGVKSLAIANAQKAYVSTYGKLFAVNLETGEKGSDVADMPYGFDITPLFAPFIKVENTLYGMEMFDDKLCVVDIASEKNTINELPESVGFMMKGTEGKLLMISGRGKLMQYSTKENKVTDTQELPERASLSVAAAPSRNEIYFHSQKNRGQIIRYNYKTKTSETFASVENVEYVRLYVDEIGGKLYYTYKIGGSSDSFKTLIYKLDDKAPATPVGTPHNHTNIDAIYAITY